MEKRLIRSKTNRKLLGVCGGIGEYCNIDPTIIRILWIIGFFAMGLGLIAYLIVAIIMPEE
ncbi:MAG: PspC domain-containing protein [Clostridiales bacterium]|nr:PspC domain-containing protein [Clostridiales bacterium]